MIMTSARLELIKTYLERTCERMEAVVDVVKPTPANRVAMQDLSEAIGRCRSLEAMLLQWALEEGARAMVQAECGQLLQTQDTGIRVEFPKDVLPTRVVVDLTPREPVNYVVDDRDYRDVNFQDVETTGASSEGCDPCL